MVGEPDGLNANAICCELMTIFEDIDFPDDVFLEFSTVKLAVDFINHKINQH